MHAIRGALWTHIISDGWRYHSVEVNFPPTLASAEGRLYGSMSGNAYVAVRRWRERLSDGSDKVHDLGEDYWNWRPVIVGFASSVTFATFTYDETAYATCRVDFWG
jgi:hypothetical protein